MHFKHTTFLVLALAMVYNWGCTHSPMIHRMEIRQGTVLSDTAMAELKPGMTKEACVLLLGPPSVGDPFHPNRWEYIERIEKHGKLLHSKRITLYFMNDKLERVVKDS